jgi:hypothetical protein
VSSLATVLVAVSDFLNPDQGPEQTGDFEVSPAFFFVLFGIGFLVGVIGHVSRSRVLVAAGVIIVFMATVFLPIALNVAN